ncbi:hypothetical protein MP478_15255 [Chryseobacterium sp. WG14]|uniref:hypothetical protein n=1 Tax=Chryseobacterium sp. WG14 TaxID=2926909 RepID=UPI00211F0632|nr:hypothetical protein [Chryseobacterium sp. WG14]MCQ9640744.1 hypothetical protein [Chryseobacterium sp. WG14]
MERHTAIYLFNKAKAATNLYEDLQRLYHTQTFEEYIEDRKKELNDDKISYDRILKTVRNDMNSIMPHELLEIILFLNHQIYPMFSSDPSEARDEYFKTLYHHLGITRLYQLPGTKASAAYAYQYENYTDFFPIDKLGNGNWGANIRSEDFLRFNDYLILTAKRIIESRLCDEDITREEEIIINTIKTENQDNALLFEIIGQELEFLTKVFYPNDKSPYTQTVYHAYAFLKQSIEMRSKINIQKNPRIIISDSYY